MALIEWESFDGITSAQINLIGWEGGGVIETAVGRFGTNGLRINNATSVAKTFQSNYTTLVVGQATHILNPPANNPYLIAFREGTTIHIGVRYNSTTRELYIDRAGTTVNTGYFANVPATNFYLEFKATIHDTTGSWELRVNETSIMSQTSVDTRNGLTGIVNNYLFNGVDMGSISMGIDDWWLDDSAFNGDLWIQNRLVNGNGTTTQWDGSDGNQVDNYLLVDDVNHDSDTTYVVTSVPGEIDLYALENLTTAAGTVKGVAIKMIVRKDDSGARVVQPIIRTNSINFFGTGKSIGASYELVKGQWLLNPDTTGAWTISEINNLEVGIELDS